MVTGMLSTLQALLPPGLTATPYGGGMISPILQMLKLRLSKVKKPAHEYAGP